MYKYLSNVRISDDLEIPILFSIYIEPRLNYTCEIVDAHEIVDGKEISFDLSELDEEELEYIEDRAYKAWENKYKGY